ncbi:hypothetical protein WICMUC_000994 [Wickerhamomyces mucosus]|uniref:Uncharacterized protein n=1 Tax=Wickerhamomyces mucosus TaxID=1378264 RepID=A0A9P8PY63_9ASCO|nr:hypothetical protein WICMUC_000994 [Wickerhamomyces mucosus]
MEHVKSVVSDWIWDSVDLPTADLGIEEFNSKIKEKLTVDKLSIQFMKSALRAKPMVLEIKQLNSSLLKTKFLVSQKFIPSVDATLGIKDKVNFEYVFSDWEIQTDMWKTVQESDVLKELICISKDVKTFVSEALKSSVSFIPLSRIRSRRASPYFVEMLELNESEVINDPALSFITCPDIIKIEKKEESDYLDEEIDEDYETLSKELNSERAISQLKIKLKSRYTFMLHICDLHETVIPKYICDRWVGEDFEIKNTNLQSLELLILDEGLEKGLEYRVTPPYMLDDPVFQEYHTAFEFAFLHIPAKLKVQSSKNPLAFLKQLATHINEFDLIDECLDSLQLEVFYKTEIKPKIIKATELYLTEPIPGNISDSDVQASDIHISIEKQELVNETLATKTVTSDIDSYFKTSNVMEALGNTATTSRNVTVLDTSMDTEFVEHGYIQNCPSKTCVDDEIDNLILRRKKRKTLSNPTVSCLPILEYLKCSTQPQGKIKEIGKNIDSCRVEVTSTKNEIRLLPDLFLDAHATIGFNLHYIAKNQAYLRFLNLHASNLKIIELELGENQVDILLGCTAGIIFVDAKSLEQVDMRGNLIIGSRLISLKESLQTLYVVIICDETLKHESLLNFQIALSLMGAKSIVSGNSLKTQCALICEIVREDSSKGFKSEDLDLVETPPIKFLMNFGITPFAAVEMLKLKSLLNILTMEKKEMLELFEFLTDSIMQKLNIFLNLPWTVEG